MSKRAERPARIPSRLAGCTVGRLPRWLWLGLGLGLMFVLDHAVLNAVAPLQGSRLIAIVTATIRWIGTDRFEFAALAGTALVGVVVSRRLTWAGLWGMAALALSDALALAIKVIVHRPRPWVTADLPQRWPDYRHLDAFHSFPSEDSASAFAIAATVGCFFPRARVPLLLVAALVAAERVLLYAHHPSDVWAGAILGLAVSELLALVRNRGRSGAAARAERVQ